MGAWTRPDLVSPRTLGRRARPRPGGDLYDLAYGPPAPTTRRPVPGEWDDPTFVAVEVDEEWMARAQAEGIREERADTSAALRQAAGQFGYTVEEYRERREPSRVTVQRVLDALGDRSLTRRQIADGAGLSMGRVADVLRWLTLIEDVHRCHPPGNQRVWLYRPATPAADAAWTIERRRLQAEVDEQVVRHREAVERRAHERIDESARRTTPRWPGRPRRARTTDSSPAPPFWYRLATPKADAAWEAEEQAAEQAAREAQRVAFEQAHERAEEGVQERARRRLGTPPVSRRPASRTAAGLIAKCVLARPHTPYSLRQAQPEVPSSRVQSVLDEWKAVGWVIEMGGIYTVTDPGRAVLGPAVGAPRPSPEAAASSVERPNSHEHTLVASVAAGRHTVNDIVRFTGLAPAVVAPALMVLSDNGTLERVREPVPGQRGLGPYAYYLPDQSPPAMPADPSPNPDPQFHRPTPPRRSAAWTPLERAAFKALGPEPVTTAAVAAATGVRHPTANRVLKRLATTGQAVSPAPGKWRRAQVDR